MSVSNVDEEYAKRNELPLMASLFYDHYSYDIFDFEYSLISRVYEFRKEIFADTDPNVEDRIESFLGIKMISVLCHLAETLAIFGKIFAEEYASIKQELESIFKKMNNYSIGEIADFYRELPRRDNSYFLPILGYPHVEFQAENTQKLIIGSVDRAKDILIRIANLYEEYREFYNIYKHGTRFVVGYDYKNLRNVVLFSNKELEQKFLQIDNSLVKDILNSIYHGMELLKICIENHSKRIEFEQNQRNRISLTYYIKESDLNIYSEDHHFLFKSREQEHEIDKECKKLISELGAQLRSDLGKFVAIDKISQKVIAKDFNKINVVKALHSLGAENKCIVCNIKKHYFDT